MRNCSSTWLFLVVDILKYAHFVAALMEDSRRLEPHRRSTYARCHECVRLRKGTGKPKHEVHARGFSRASRATD